MEAEQHAVGCWITNDSQKKSKKEIKICIEMNENENTTTPNLWDTGLGYDTWTTRPQISGFNIMNVYFTLMLDANHGYSDTLFYIIFTLTKWQRITTWNINRLHGRDKGLRLVTSISTHNSSARIHPRNLTKTQSYQKVSHFGKVSYFWIRVLEYVKSTDHYHIKT